jgi:hypothetical protein
MASFGKIIRDDKHPVWLVDAIVLSAVVYSSAPEEELKIIEREYGLPATARYEFVAEKELRENGYGNCKQTLLVVRSLVDSHYIVACRGSSDISDALVDLRFLHRTMSLTPVLLTPVSWIVPRPFPWSISDVCWCEGRMLCSLVTLLEVLLHPSLLSGTKCI